jgi:hypothetical protein
VLEDSEGFQAIGCGRMARFLFLEKAWRLAAVYRMSMDNSPVIPRCGAPEAVMNVPGMASPELPEHCSQNLRACGPEMKPPVNLSGGYVAAIPTNIQARAKLVIENCVLNQAGLMSCCDPQGDVDEELDVFLRARLSSRRYEPATLSGIPVSVKYKATIPLSR